VSVPLSQEAREALGSQLRLPKSGNGVANGSDDRIEIPEGQTHTYSWHSQNATACEFDQPSHAAVTPWGAGGPIVPGMRSTRLPGRPRTLRSPVLSVFLPQQDFVAVKRRMAVQTVEPRS
jgi:hypothetical protein